MNIKFKHLENDVIKMSRNAKKHIKNKISEMCKMYSIAQLKKLSLSEIDPTANGYAIVYGGTETTKRYKLVSFAGGLDANANITDIRHSFLPQLKFSEQLNMGSANSLEGSFFTFGITPSTSGSIRRSGLPM